MKYERVPFVWRLSDSSNGKFNARTTLTLLIVVFTGGLLQPPRELEVFRWELPGDDTGAPAACLPALPRQRLPLARCQQSLLVIVALPSVPWLLLLKWAETPVLWQYMVASLHSSLATTKNRGNKAFKSILLWVIVAQSEIPVYCTTLVIILTALRSARPPHSHLPGKLYFLPRTSGHARSLGPDTAATSTIAKNNSNNVRLVWKLVLNPQLMQDSTISEENKNKIYAKYTKYKAELYEVINKKKKT